MCGENPGSVCRISFIGHSDFLPNPSVEQVFFNVLSEEIDGQYPVEFYFGGYGNFDAFAYKMTRKYQKEHPDINMKFVFVTPYMTESHQKNHLNPIRHKYDEILYPPIEDKPLRYAIVYRKSIHDDACKPCSSLRIPSMGRRVADVPLCGQKKQKSH